MLHRQQHTDNSRTSTYFSLFLKPALAMRLAIKRLSLLSLPCLLGGCATLSNLNANGLPYDTWCLGFRAPARMQARIVTVYFEDSKGRPSEAIVHDATIDTGDDDPTGWGRMILSQKERSIYGIRVPKRVHVHWQSLVEERSYQATIEVPEEVRRLMLTRTRTVSSEGGGPAMGLGAALLYMLPSPPHRAYPNELIIGLAPGGWIKGWVAGNGVPAMEVFCTRAQVNFKEVAQAPSGESDVSNLEQLAPITQEYLKNHPIPYDSWKCPNEEMPATS